MPTPGVCSKIVDGRRKNNGYGTVNNPERLFDQDFNNLKMYCKIHQQRFVDKMFPPDNASIGMNLLKPEELQRVVWLRPHKMVSMPCFTVDGISRFDFGQGILGNCWFLASIGALTFKDDILRQVVPMDQDFNGDYCGMFRFRFWRFGQWVEVVIDDKLPTINKKLIFVHSRESTEFWPALLEKAYAKVCGSYSDMASGMPSEALMDFTGGVHICLTPSENPPELWEMMRRAGRSTALMSCGTKRGTAENIVLANGMVLGHAYAVTGIKTVESYGRLVKLVRLWNPWGRQEWNGDWCDNSKLWDTVSIEDRNLCLSVRDDGEFWMTLEDFCEFYDDLDICCTCPEFLDENVSCHWKRSSYEGRWVAGTTAGGCMESMETFWTNPQYRVWIEPLNHACGNDMTDKNILVSLIQKPDKRHRAMVQKHHIGFTIFEITDEYKKHRGKFQTSFFKRNRAVAHTKVFMDSREVMELLTLKPGEYLIVPSTFKPNQTSSFLLTILSKSETNVHESSITHFPEHVEEPIPVNNREKREDKRKLFRQYSDKYEEVDAEQLQVLLNENILKGDMRSGGFTLDACRSLVSLMDTSITGKLNAAEFVNLWDEVVTYKEVFFRTDVDRTGTLSLGELRNAIIASGNNTDDEMLNLLALRYGSAGHVTLENFICLILRFNRMNNVFRQLSHGDVLSLCKAEWLYITMYT